MNKLIEAVAAFIDDVKERNTPVTVELFQALERDFIVTASGQEPDTIINQGAATFSFKERLRILFGAKYHIQIEMDVPYHVPILKTRVTSSYVDTLFPRKEKGQAHTPDKQSTLGNP